jgi:hypothetical protein
MLFWSLMFLFVVLSAGLLVIGFAAAGARKSNPDVRWDRALDLPWLRHSQGRSPAAACRIVLTRLGRLNWGRSVRYFAIGATVFTAALITVGIHYVYFDRTALPDIEPFVRFEFPTIGTVYDANGQPFIELAREHRRLTKYEELPRIVRDAIIAAEDKRFFSHSGVDYSVIPRLLAKSEWSSGRTYCGLRTARQSAVPARRINDHPTACARVFS